jgi:hypothetical protein
VREVVVGVVLDRREDRKREEQKLPNAFGEKVQFKLNWRSRKIVLILMNCNWLINDLVPK